LGKLCIRDRTLIAHGDIGYDQAGEFATLCARLLGGSLPGGTVIDLTAAGDLVSPCLAAVYDDCRLHRPVELTVIAPRRLAHLFAPGQAEGLFAVREV
jgi:hypothetical protein